MPTPSISGGVVISGARILLPIDLATIEPGVVMPVSGSIVITGQTGTLDVNAVGPLFMLDTYAQTNLASGVTLTSSSTNILATGTLQNLVLDVVYGTVAVGSIQTSIWGVEPQSRVLTSVLVQGSWYSGTVQAGQRLVASAPLGAQVAVINTVIGRVMDVYITAEQST
jgi:hypothetical protein